MVDTSKDAVIASLELGDVQLRRAYSDYMATKNALGDKSDASLGDLATLPLRYLRQHGRMDKLEKIDEYGSAAIKINVQTQSENEPWLLVLRSRAVADAGAGPKGAIDACIKDVIYERAEPFAMIRLAASENPADSRGLSDTAPQSKEAAQEFAKLAAGLDIPVGIADEVYHPVFKDARMDIAAVIAAVPAVNLRREEPSEDDCAIAIDIPEGGERRLLRMFADGDVLRMIKSCKAGSGRSLECVVSAGQKDVFGALAASYGLDSEILKNKKAFDNNEAADDNRSGDNSKESIRIKAEAPGDWQKSPLAFEGINFADAMRRVAADGNVCSRRGLSSMFDSSLGGGQVLAPLGGDNQLTPVQAAAYKIPLKNGASDDCVLGAFGYNPYVFEASPYHGAYLAVVESVAKMIASGASFSEVYLAIQDNAGMDAAAKAKDNAGQGAHAGTHADEKVNGDRLAALLGAFEAEMGLGICSTSFSDEIACAFSKDESKDPAENAAEDGGSETQVGLGRSDDYGAPYGIVPFALTVGRAAELCTPEFKSAGHKVVMLRPETDTERDSAYRDLPNPGSLVACWRKAYELIASGRAVSAYTPGTGGIAESIMKMSYGAGIGFEFASDDTESAEGLKAGDVLENDEIFGYSYGAIILEMADFDPIKTRSVDVITLGYTSDKHSISKGGESVGIGELLISYEGRLESVYPTNADGRIGALQELNYAARSWPTPIFKRARPKMLIPLFDKSSGESEAVRLIKDAGGDAETILINDDEAEFAEALGSTQILYLPSGRAGLDEDICKLLLSPEVKDTVSEFLDKKDGLICGVGSGFNALLQLGLLPYGKYYDSKHTEEGTGSSSESGEGGAGGEALSDGVASSGVPRIETNSLGSHVSSIVRVRVASNKSPWLRASKPGDIFSLPISTSEGRFAAGEELLRKLCVNGQVATQYVDAEGKVSSDARFNPCGSMMAVEALTSPDGRIIGRIGHFERTGSGLYVNVPGSYVTRMFANAVRYFK